MSTPRRLISLPGVDALEFTALKKPRMAEPDALAEFPEIADCIKANFGLTPEEAEAARPDDWDGIDEKAPQRQVEAFAAAGWDVTDDRKRPLRLLGHFSPAMWLAIRGVAGSVPAEAWVPEKDTSSAWGAAMQADATRFRKDRR